MKIYSSLDNKDIERLEELREEFLRLVKDNQFGKLVKFINVAKKVDSLYFKIKNSLEDQDKIEKYKKDLESQKAKEMEFIKEFGKEVNKVVIQFFIVVNSMRVKELFKEVNFMEWLVSKGQDFNYHSVRG